MVVVLRDYVLSDMHGRKTPILPSPRGEEGNCQLLGRQRQAMRYCLVVELLSRNGEVGGDVGWRDVADGGMEVVSVTSTEDLKSSKLKRSGDITLP